MRLCVLVLADISDMTGGGIQMEQIPNLRLMEHASASIKPSGTQLFCTGMTYCAGLAEVISL